jgi:kynurenine formamidase
VRVVDLTRPLDERTVLWPGSVPFEASGPAEYDEDGFWWRDLSLPEHAGTHLDAPRHRVPDGASVADIPAERLVRPALRIDAGDGGLGAADVEAWEAVHGRVQEGAAVLLRTGWDSDPLAAPGYRGDAAELLVERGVAGLGIDTLSVDAGDSSDFPVHRTTLPAGLWHLEGLTGLEAVPPTGATIVVGALKLPGGSGTPARVLALLP